MKQILFCTLWVLSGGFLYAQAPPNNTVPLNGGETSTDYWSRSGNNSNANNILGLKINSPLYTVTGNGFSLPGTTYRTKINAIHSNATQYSINGYGWTQGVNTSGYMLIGNSNNSMTDGLNIYQNKGAFSLLHLNGETSSGQYQELGYRPWMKTGITLTGNRDLSYMGLRQLGTGEDVTETSIVWSDNTPGSGSGEDEMVFRYTSGAGGATTYNTDFSNAYDFDGLHVARYTAFGLMGLGNTFGLNVGVPGTIVYNSPQSLLHMSYQYRYAAATPSANEAFGFMQVTYRRQVGTTVDTIGQGEQVTDGLRLGIDNQLYGSSGFRHLNSYLRWQEASSFIVQTEDGGAANIEQNERMRITSIGALRKNYTTNQYFGLTDSLNVTRIGISESGRFPLTRPKSLLHLGYDYGSGIFAMEGYRKWMDLGVLTSNSKDHVWLGLKTRDSLNSSVTQGYDKLDAVLAWGTDRNVTSPTQVDKMRFIFTGHILDANPENAPGVSYQGLEMMRMYPATVYQHYKYNSAGAIIDSVQGYGRVGVGDFTAYGVNQEPTQKLDVVGNGRFRYLPDSTFLADPSVTKYVMVDSLGVLRWGQAPFGVVCADTLGGDFQSDRHVELNDYNFYFSNNSTTDPDNNVGFGWDCGAPLKAKVDVYQNGPGGIGGSFLVDAGTTSYPLGRTGVSAIVYGGATNLSMGVEGQALTNGSDINIGVYGRAGRATNSYSVYGAYAGGTGNYAGYFNGDVQAGGTFITSDSILKNEVNPLTNGLDIVTKLKPKTYYMDVENYEQFGFNDQLQYGFLAQDVQALLPTAVKASVQPGGADENGDFVYNPTEYLALNYNAIIPINTQAIIELNQKVEKATLSDESIKTNIQDLNGSLNKVLEMRGVSYDWNHTVHPELNLDSANHIGFIAQEIAQIDSRLTYLADDELLHIEYDKVVPILAEAIQELNGEVESKDSIIDALTSENTTQQETIEDLNTRLTQLENCLSGILPFLCQLSQSAIQANTPEAQEAVRKNLTVTLIDRTAIVLDQNVPNPFAEQTVINFSIPATVQKAQIHFYDGNGKLIQSVDVVDRGLGSLTVFGSDLSSGTYTYTLVADGQIVATKKMVKQ